MTAEPRGLAPLSRARRLLAKAATVPEIRDVRDKAQLAKIYARKKGLTHEIVVEASAIEVQAERKLGELLGKIRMAKASSGNQYTGKLDLSQGKSVDLSKRSAPDRISKCTAATTQSTRSGQFTEIKFGVRTDCRPPRWNKCFNLS